MIMSEGFLVGDGSYELMRRSEKHEAEGHASLKKPVWTMDKSFVGSSEDGQPYELADDVGDYVQACEYIEDESRYLEVFIDAKRKIYDIFNYVGQRSATLSGKAIREQDIILQDGDRYVIMYMRENGVKAVPDIKSVASLLAYESMSISDVLFRQVDGCLLCRAYHGSVLSTRHIVNTLVSGGYITHPKCKCQFDPLINHATYQGPLSAESLYTSFKVVGGRTPVSVINIPVELDTVASRSFFADLDVSRVSFVDMHDLRREMGSEVDTSDTGSLMVHLDEERGNLYVHRDIVGILTPLDLLREFWEQKSRSVERLPEDALSAATDRYYLDGRCVVLHDGRYWDAKTGVLVG